MTCASRVGSIMNGARGIAGVSDFQVDLMGQSGSGIVAEESLNHALFAIAERLPVRAMKAENRIESNREML